MKICAFNKLKIYLSLLIIELYFIWVKGALYRLLYNQIAKFLI
jgi:hypothetical protein